MDRLRRKIDDYLIEWKNKDTKMPLIVKGARQIGKTNAIRNFGENNYKAYIEINFVFQTQFLTIFDDGYEVDNIIKNISMKLPDIEIVPNETLIFFDEMQKCPNCVTALKAFNLDGRYDVICSGSLMGINYEEIESNSVGNKEDYIMYSMDFEEFLWAKGYKESHIEDLYNHMVNLESLSKSTYDVMMRNFKDYMILGGFPRIVSRYIENKNFSGVLKMQKQIILDYEEDITKYSGELNKGRILDAYRKIPIFLGDDNKKFKITKLNNNARSREYVGVVDWLSNAGIVNVSHALTQLALPLKGNYDVDNYRLYFADTGLLIGSLEEEVQEDLRNNENFNTYKGAIYENIVADMLVKEGYDLFFYRNDTKRIEIDFVIRDKDTLIPIEVKAGNSNTYSLNKILDLNKDIKYGIKLCDDNIGFNGKFYTFPYFLTFLLKRYLKDDNRKNCS